MENKIAVIGMACRFPGAKDLNEFWSNLLSGKDTIRHFSDEELAGYEIDFENLKKNPDYVRAKGILNDIDKFDANFFGLTPGEAAGTDPQHRLWFETVWEAFENAGCDPINYKGAIGVFAGSFISTYLLNNILRDRGKLENYIRLRSSESYQVLTSNDPSYISTRTAYKFNLKGPAINVQTACSTSLVAISLACQSLYSYESDVCVSGGVCVSVPQESGYLYQEGAIPSPDGCCRPFDAQGKGTVLSNGIGVVILKRMEDAIRDGDNIYALVRGWALNNDGSNKVSYTAPGIDGQAEVIMMAQSFAGVLPDEIGYVEAHGTATQLGDPVEVMALTKAFSGKTDRKQFCGLGSVKSNIGHTDAAAGVASFIKTSLSAYYKTIPPSVHFSEPNKNIDFKNSPFYVQSELKQWTDGKPLIMGVSSFGIGGTNAHVIIEEPPARKINPVTGSQEWPHLLLLSARSEYSRDKRKNDLVEFINDNPGINLRDIAFTLLTGRNHMRLRSFMVAQGRNEVLAGGNKFIDGRVDELISKIVFMFPGQGAQYVSMGKSLYSSSLMYRQILDECFEILRTETGRDLKPVLFSIENVDEAEKILASTEMAQPALFIVEYALAQVLIRLGIKPDYLIGHSIGEYASACIAGVFDMKTALKIVIRRGQLMRSMPGGKMFAVKACYEKLESIQSSLFEIGADNSTATCTISFKETDTEKVRTVLDENSIQYILLNTSHAFHSADFDPILKEFADFVNQFVPRPPELPFISCLTGEFITPEQATSGEYWAKQLRNTVQFRKGITNLGEKEDVAFLEVGPNTHLSSLVKQNKNVANKQAIISSLGKSDNVDDKIKIMNVLGNLFNLGLHVDHECVFTDEKPVRVILPSYPFERKRHWIDFNLSDYQVINHYQNNISKTGFSGSGDTDVMTDLLTGELQQGNVVQAKLINIWKSIIGSGEIEPDMNFFELGGHSLLALQLIARMKKEFKQNITLDEFLENPTINQLSKIIKLKDISDDGAIGKLPHEEINIPASCLKPDYDEPVVKKSSRGLSLKKLFKWD